MPTDAELTATTAEFGKDSAGATWTLANLQKAGWSDWQICGRYEFAVYVKANSADKAPTAPQFWLDFSDEKTSPTTAANKIEAKQTVGEKLEASWDSYFKQLVTVKQLITLDVKYTEANDMYNYAQQLYRQAQQTRSSAIYTAKDITNIARDAKVDIKAASTTLANITKQQYGLIAWGLMQQTKHKIEKYSDLEINSFSYKKAEGFNSLSVFTLVMDQFWTDEDIQLIIEAARGLTVDDKLIAAVDLAILVAADTKCAAATCTTAENAANLVKRKTAIATNQILDFYLRLQRGIQLHKLDYPVQTAEVLADDKFKRISDSTSEKVTISYAETAKSNIFDYGLTLTDLV
jgi:hypothetical protein